MAEVEDIRAAFKGWASADGPPVTNLATVTEVDETAGTCTLADEDGLEIFDVRLRPVLTGNQSFILIPKIGTTALAVRIEDDEDWMVVAADEITKVMWKTETGLIELSETLKLQLDQTTIELAEKIKMQNQHENMAVLMKALINAILSLQFVVSGASTTTMMNAATFLQLRTRFDKLFE